MTPDAGSRRLHLLAGVIALVPLIVYLAFRLAAPFMGTLEILVIITVLAVWAGLGFGGGWLLKRHADRRGGNGDAWLIAWALLWVFAPVAGNALLLVAYALTAGGRRRDGNAPGAAG